jgi:hypothetical protein
MLLADDYFLLAHDDRSGRANIFPKSLELGLAGVIAPSTTSDRVWRRISVVSTSPASVRHGVVATLSRRGTRWSGNGSRMRHLVASGHASGIH